MSNTPRTDAACGLPTNSHEETAQRLYECSVKLERDWYAERQRARAFIKQFYQRRAEEGGTDMSTRTDIMEAAILGDTATLRALLAEVEAEDKRMTLMLSAFSVNPDRIGQCEIAQARASNDAMWDTLNQLREARTDLSRWRTVADGLAEQLREKEGYGPVADLREYNAANKGTT
jgi:hypothetical protein